MRVGDRWGDRLPSFPETAVRRYQAAGAWTDRTIGEQLHATAQRFPDRTAVAALDGRLSYAELDARTDQIAVGLRELGLRPGDPVLFQVDNRLHTVLAWYGVLKAGLVPVATLAQHRRHEIDQISRRVEAVAHLVDATPGAKFDLLSFAAECADGHPTLRHVLTIGAPTPTAGSTRVEDLSADPLSARETVRAIQADLDPTDVAVFQLSGGTTDVPKVIPRRHAEYWYNSLAYARGFGLTEHSRVAHILPIAHNAGIVCGVHAAHSVGACLLLGVPDVTACFPFLVAERVTHILVGHAHFLAIGETGIATLAGSLEKILLSGTKVPPELFATIERHGIWSGQNFGMGEGFFALTPPDAPREARLVSVGVALSELDEFRILEPGGERELPDGETGELCCRGPYTIPGYLDSAEHNSVAFTSDGFYRTGDLASVLTFDGRRYLSIDGRLKDVISRGGEKVNAEEVEGLLLRHPAITEAAVVAMPDPRLGERACAFVVARDEPVTLDDVREHLAALGVAKFKWPERLERVDRLPRSNVGKVDKRSLRAAAAALVS
ncbi:(2,3-dihydroxybenzoyl)adenylate synthase [Kutzneria sp. NPDC052558]|uniref:(2,3-dihydroxybenzoyl)adenylate synthase n=1 Tax=Kutzneria sp. NPDC052558 TaxID=3364121 RepID=UPI0037C65A2C